ncbi:hypothetical protein FB451DRAFT_1180777 [Mycena latifolia]|nr:hypothetical protein FB451DRAFT_1180777 [Mycena latifolia]
MAPKLKLEVAPVYITLGFPFPVGVSVQRKNDTISPSYPARTAFVFKVRDMVLAAELLEVQHTYLDALKDIFPSNPSPVKKLEKLAVKVYKAVPTTAVARPLYPIATGAKAPFVMVHYSDAQVYQDTACNWRRVECVRDALVYMILGGNETSIASLNLSPVVSVAKVTTEGASTVVGRSTKSEPPHDTPPTIGAVRAAAGTSTPARKKPHCRTCGQPCKGHSAGACQVALRRGDGSDKRTGDVVDSPRSLVSGGQVHPSSASVMSVPPITSWVVESESDSADGAYPDSAPVSDSVSSESESDSSASEASSDHYNARRIAFGTFDSIKEFVQAPVEGGEDQIRIMVVPKKTLIEAANFLMLKGFRYLIDGSPGPSTIHIYFGTIQARVERAYLKQSRRREIPLAGIDNAMKAESYTVCDTSVTGKYERRVLGVQRWERLEARCGVRTPTAVSNSNDSDRGGSDALTPEKRKQLFVEIKNLDGERNFESRHAVAALAHLGDTASENAFCVDSEGRVAAPEEGNLIDSDVELYDIGATRYMSGHRPVQHQVPDVLYGPAAHRALSKRLVGKIEKQGGIDLEPTLKQAVHWAHNGEDHSHIAHEAARNSVEKGLIQGVKLLVKLDKSSQPGVCKSSVKKIREAPRAEKFREVHLDLGSPTSVTKIQKRMNLYLRDCSWTSRSRADSHMFSCSKARTPTVGGPLYVTLEDTVAMKQLRPEKGCRLAKVGTRLGRQRQRNAEHRVNFDASQKGKITS